MQPWVRYLICGVAGLALGAGAAVQRVRTGALGASTAIGPWTTGKDFGTTGASAFTRAVVSLRGILALPAHEARYYNAAVDSAGQPLDGKCRYRVTGKAIPAKWWSLTLYDHPGYLVANQAEYLLDRERARAQSGELVGRRRAGRTGRVVAADRADRPVRTDAQDVSAR